MTAAGTLSSRLARIHPDADVQAALAAEGLHSAVAISQQPAGEFLRRIAPRLAGDQRRARQAYAQATRIANSVMHAWANVHSAVRDPHFGALKVANLGAGGSVAFDELPSYQELFGSQDYCSCEECASILGAAAYLVDLLRIIDAYVTQPNADPKTAAYTFPARRPDIGGIPLTCESTNLTFPMLQVVNERLTALAAGYLGNPPDVVAALATVSYPFQLPFHQPWEQILRYLGQIQVQLQDVYAAFGAGAPDLTRARFGISTPLLSFACTSLAGNADALATSYGVTAAQLAGLADVSAFLAATGLQLSDLTSLLVQGLSAAELSGGVAAGLFINGGLSGQWLTYQPAGAAATIGNLAGAPADPLDRMSRFVRLAGRLNWDSPTLDWALRTVGGGRSTITPAVVGQLGQLDQLAQRLQLDVPTMCAVIGSLKPYGAGDGPVSQAPFDLAFNDPRLVGTDIYQPPTPLNPGYASALRMWTIGSSDPAQQQLAVRLAAATSLSAADLLALAGSLWGSSATVSLTFANLAALYRHATLRRGLRMGMSGYLALLGLMGYQQNQLLTPTLALGDVAAIADRAGWLPGSGLSLDQISYFLGGPVPPTVDPLFQAAALPSWLGTVRAAAGSLTGQALQQAVTGQLALLFTISPELATALARQAAAAVSPPAMLSWPQAFAAAPTIVGGTPPYLDFVTQFVTVLSRWQVLSAALRLPQPLLLSLLGTPQAYGFDQPANLAGVYWLSTFQQLTARYGDQAGRLVNFVDPSTLPGGDPVAALAAATGWAPAPLATLLAPASATVNRVQVIQQVAIQFGVLTSLGADPAFVSRLVALTTDPTTAWADYTALADQVLSTVRTRIPDTQWPVIANQLNGEVQARLRDVLAPLVLFHLGADQPAIASMDNLSDFLLIDVETSAAPQISRIREALNAAQQYLQRCRLNLEPITVFEIPESWWEWLTSYTVWQANREVFLYPENYLDPTLRTDKTKLFTDLQNQLQQSEVTDGAVDTAYRSYLDGLVKLSDLEYVDAYRCTVDDAEQGQVDTTFLFARTATDPYSYYSISYANGVWGSWQPMAVTIPAPVITPVYAFNRLFVFWVELKVAKDAQIAGSAGSGSSQGVGYQATIKYSFIDFNGNWIQPQVLVADEVVYYMPTEDNQTGALGALSDRLDLFNMSDLFWKRVSAVVVDPPGAAPDPAQQRLVITFGSLLQKAAGSAALTQPTSPPPPLTNPGSNAQMFAERIYEITANYNQLVGAQLYGYLPLMDSIVLDHQLNPSYVRRANEMIVLETDLRENAPPLVKPEIEQVLGTLALATADCAYVANALADWTPTLATTRPPLPVTSEMFANGPITDPQAALTALTNAGIVASGSVKPSFAGNPDLSALVPTLGEAGAAWARAALLDALGDPTLFTAVPVKTARVVAVKNRLGSFLLAVGDEAFLLTPRDVSYADLSGSTVSSPVPSSPMVFDSYFASVSPTRYNAIYLDLVGNELVTAVGSNYGLLTSGFDEHSDLSALFAGVPSAANKAAMIEQVRRILLALPSITMLTYDDTTIQRFVTPTSFISADITASGSQQAFLDLVASYLIDHNGVLLGETSATTDLSQILVGAPDEFRAEIRTVLMALPKLVQRTSFVTADITVAQSEQTFGVLWEAGLLDFYGAVSISFSATTDLSFLFPEVAEPTREVLIAEVRGVLLNFFDATYRIDSNEIAFDVERVSARTSSRELSYALFAGGIEQALSLQSQNAPVVPKLPFDRLGPSAGQVGAPALGDGAQIDFDGPYGLYYWELFFHAPLMVAQLLAANQQFEDAKRWLQFVLDPTATEQLVTPDSFLTPDISQPDSEAAYHALLAANVLVAVDGGARVDFGYTPATQLGPYFSSTPPGIVDEYRATLSNYQLATPASHYWQFRPFRNHTLESLLQTLSDRGQITVYENDPFDPDAIARLRIGAYEKSTVMKFLDVLLAWGDSLFARYTWEAITSATLVYQFAEELLGPRPVDLGPCQQPANSLTFDQIKARCGSQPIPEFLIDLEDSLPALTGALSEQAPAATPFNALDAYFGVPPNDHLASYWDLVADRLTKIRNGENLNGVPTPLALWDPPLDPMALVRAAASGSGFLPASAGPGATPTSDYRFKALFEQARQLAGGVKDLGAALLSALQNQDAAALDLLRGTQEVTLLNLGTAIKQQQIQELQKAIDGLNLSKAKAQFQADYYNGLVSAGLSAQEVTTRVLEAEAILFQAISIPVRGIAVAGYLSPSIFGLADGGMQWGDAVNQGAEIAASTSQLLSISSALTATTGEFQRRSDDWDFQAQLATRDVAIYQNQIDSTTIQLAEARQDLLMQLKSIDQANAVAGFLTSRFSNADLYTWLAGRLATVYFQSYTAAVSAARAAELAYQYEQNRTDSYIVYNYWDNLHRGLGAGETLLQSLNQLKVAYQAADQRKLEIEKTISLQQLDPSQILNLRAGKPATFAITETMLDFDFPGQYGRQLSSVSISIPALVGPYQNINAVLTQTANSVVLTPDKSVVDYLVTLDCGQTPAGGVPAGLRQNWQAQQSIAISHGRDDSGMFQLDFTGDRYMPFEGTGAVSAWQLAIPPENNRIDLSQLTDVIVTVRYNALDGGSTFDGSPSFRTDVIDVLRAHNVEFTGKLYLDAAQSFASAWYALMNPPPNPTVQTLSIGLQPGMLPYLPAPALTGVLIRLDVSDAVASTDSTTFVALSIGGASYPLAFTGGLASVTGLNLAAADFLRPWSLALTLANAPDPHLIANGTLDPTALLDVEFILSYRADVLPPAPPH